jgi:hypothetical protein
MREAALDDSELYLNYEEDERQAQAKVQKSIPKVRNLPCFSNSRNLCFFCQVLDPKWEKYACGKTKDQLYMTHLAHMCLKKTTLQPRSLNFYK